MKVELEISEELGRAIQRAAREEGRKDGDFLVDQIHLLMFGRVSRLPPVADNDFTLPRRSKRTPIKASIKEYVFNRDNGKCQICGGKVFMSGEWHVDHITPVARGGSNAPCNLQLACPACNLEKAAA